MKKAVMVDGVMQFVEEETQEEREQAEAYKILEDYVSQLSSQTDPTLRAICTILLSSANKE